MQHFKIIVPFYNVEKWIGTNIESIIGQKYENYQCFYSDDLSTDKSLEIVEKYAFNDKINIHKNLEKKYALKNIYDSIEFSKPDDEDVIIIVDGDDWLSCPEVLTKLNTVYENEDILMTYGTYIEYPTGKKPWNITKYSQEVIDTNSYRKVVWRASHLRTFKYKLWKNIKKEDFKDPNGEFFRMTGDLAAMFPMLEMSGGKFKCIEDILYCYNFTNPLNDEKLDHNFQLSMEKFIRNKKPYEKIF